MQYTPRFSRSVAILGALLFLGAISQPAQAELRITEIAPGIYYGNTPRSEEDYRQLQGMGIRTVLELRRFFRGQSDREECQVTSYGMAYRLVPMGFHPTRDCTPEAALQVVADPNCQPVYMHCLLGRDRTGLVAALYRVRYLGWSRDAAYAAMQSERFNRLLLDLDRYFWRYAR